VAVVPLDDAIVEQCHAVAALAGVPFPTPIAAVPTGSPEPVLEEQISP